MTLWFKPLNQKGPIIQSMATSQEGTDTHAKDYLVQSCNNSMLGVTVHQMSYGLEVDCRNSGLMTLTHESVNVIDTKTPIRTWEEKK